MKHKILALSTIGIAILLSGCNQSGDASKTEDSTKEGQALEQTICFSQQSTDLLVGGNKVYYGALGDDVTLNGGQCNGAKLADMNKKGWRLVQVVSGMDQSFGMVFEKQNTF